jgi:hypothetical protein
MMKQNQISEFFEIQTNCASADLATTVIYNLTIMEMRESNKEKVFFIYSEHSR